MIEYITAHSAEFMALGITLMGLGGIIVKLTPTKKDDEWWVKITGVLARLSKKA